MGTGFSNDKETGVGRALWAGNDRDPPPSDSRIGAIWTNHESLAMHFQVRTDNHIVNSEALIDGIRDEVEGALTPRFTDRIRRVEVYLQDMNSHKRGIDIRCSIEVGLAGHQPIAVEDRASAVDVAVSGAVEKVVRALDHMVGRLGDRSGRVSMSGNET